MPIRPGSILRWKQYHWQDDCLFVFCDATPCPLGDRYRRFGIIHCLLRQHRHRCFGEACMMGWRLGAAHPSEIFVYIHQISRRHFPRNLKSEIASLPPSLCIYKNTTPSCTTASPQFESTIFWAYLRLHPNICQQILTTNTKKPGILTVSAKILIGHLPDTNQQLYRFVQIDWYFRLKDELYIQAGIYPIARLTFRDQGRGRRGVREQF